jgi:N-acetylmuramoyl-L-alanine amidase
MTDRITGRLGWHPFARGPAGSAPPLWLAGAALAVCGLAVYGCGPAGAAGPAGASRPASGAPARSAAPPPAAPGGATGSASPSPSPSPAAPPLAGKIIGIDPGHNGGNFTDGAAIGQEIWNGTGWETCDTSGTTTDGGYTEAQFNFNVALDLRADLRRDGARVVLTRTSNDGVGPCVNTRSAIINHAHANVAVDIHADGGPESGRGFTILEPEADGPNDHVIAASQRFGGDVRQALLTGTSMPESDYTGTDGILPRDDLAGLDLTTVPKVLVECGNMRNATDAQMLVTAGFQARVARALTAAIVRFLAGQGQG